MNTFRKQLTQPGLIVAPGVSDAYMARMVRAAGFETIYVSGAGIANTLLGVPDLGLTTMTEMVDQITRICDASDLPVIADADNGYGNALNVQRAVRAYERAGVAAMHIEDQAMPKRCGHFNGKEVISAEEYVQKLRAALDARHDPDFVIIARTDALATHGFDEAVRRAQLYADNGADVIFIDAPTTREQIAKLPKLIHKPLLFNMVEGAKTPLFSHAELADFGYKIVIHPSLINRVIAKATLDALRLLKAEGTSASVVPHMLTWADRQQLVGLPEFEALEQKYKTV
ncbi:MAG: oxaloacetate decarboxylase [Anaerolineae bacterium]|nr:oxaloacetate decarboxylase [Anaerolineae bacterium]